jgi:hypothetical protein
MKPPPKQLTDHELNMAMWKCMGWKKIREEIIDTGLWRGVGWTGCKKGVLREYLTDFVTSRHSTRLIQEFVAKSLTPKQAEAVLNKLVSHASDYSKTFNPWMAFTTDWLLKFISLIPRHWVVAVLEVINPKLFK